MVKMAELHAEGVRNLHDYNEGFEAGYEALRKEAIKMITDAMNNKNIGVIPSKLALAILLSGFQLQVDSEDD